MAMHEVGKAGTGVTTVAYSEAAQHLIKSQPITDNPTPKDGLAFRPKGSAPPAPAQPSPAKPIGAARAQNSKAINLNKADIKSALDEVLKRFPNNDGPEADFEQKNINRFYRIMALSNSIEALVTKAGKMDPPFTNLPNPAVVNQIHNLIHDVYAKDPFWNDIHTAIVSTRDGLIRTAIKQLDEVAYGPNQKFDVTLESGQAKAIIKFAADAVMEENQPDGQLKKLTDFIESGVDNLDLHKMDVLVAIAEQCSRRRLRMPEGPKVFVENASKPMEFEKLPLASEAKP
jgi:hypothetical protein